MAGRSPQAQIPIKDPSMSREHCDILLQNGIATVVDRGSMNGTLVNGKRMDRKVLQPGDKVQIGKADIYFEAKKGGAKAAPEPQAAVVGIDDYSVWRRETGGLAKIVVGLVVFGAIAAGAVVLFQSMGKGTRVVEDPANLLGGVGRFDPGPVVGWAMRPGQASRLQVLEGSAKEGKGCLQIDKTGAAPDLMAEAQNQEVHATPPSGAVEASAWVRSEASGILTGLKIAWMATKKGPVIFEESSELAAGGSSWSQIQNVFVPPTGAAAFQLSLVAAGRAGRVQFDDVRLKAGTPGAAPKSGEFSGHGVTASSAGILSVSRDTRRILNNFQIFLANEKEGTISQVASSGVTIEIEDGGKKLTAKGKLPNPTDLRPVAFEIEVRGGPQGPLVGFRLSSDSLKLVDRIGVSVLLPSAELKGDYTNPVSRVWFRSEAGDYLLELSDGLMRVGHDHVAGARRLTIGIPIQRGTAEVAFAFQLKSGAGGQTDPRALAKELDREGKPSEALEVWKELRAATREEAKQKEIDVEIARLVDVEAVEWKGVLAQGFRAELVGLKPYYEDALAKLDQYEKRWPSKRVETAKAERAKLTAGHAAAAEDREALRAHRLLDRAEEHRKEGRKHLARELCESVRRHYGSTSAAARAAELLKSLGSD